MITKGSKRRGKGRQKFFLKLHKILEEEGVFLRINSITVRIILIFSIIIKAIDIIRPFKIKIQR